MHTVAEQDQACFRTLFSILNSHFRLLVSGFRPRDFSTDQRALTMSRPPSRHRARRPRRFCSSLVNDELGYFVRFRYFYLIFFDGPPYACLLYQLRIYIEPCLFE
jgi:hypothetical protein